MSLDFTIVTYVDGETVIGADNLNDIQDAILDLDDNKVEKEQGKGLSANDFTDTDKQKVDDAYVVPEGGIPKSALADAVQTSLGKADTALQEDDLAPYRTAEEQDEIDNAIDDRASVPNTVGPTAVATFESSFADDPIKELTVNIEPVQSGTGDPSPENVRPISGWTGCKLLKTGQNLLCDTDYTDGTTAGVQYTKLSDGSYLATGTITDKPARYLIGGNWGRTFKPGKYQASCDGVSSNGIRLTVAYVQRYGQSPKYIDITDPNVKRAFEIEPTGYLYSAYFRGETTGTQVNTVLKPLLLLQKNAGSEWEPVQYTTYPITFPSPDPGTVYGGSLDVVSGVLTVDYGIVTVTQFENALSGMEGNGFRTKTICPGATNIAYSQIYCNMFSSAGSNAEAVNNDGLHPNTLGLNSQGRVLLNAVVNGNIVTDLADINSFIPQDGCKIIYPLASPISYQLTPQEITTLLGTNNIWADCGNVTVTYGAYLKDIKDYADHVDSGILSAVAPLEETYTASHSYAVGSYLFVGTKFYKVTSAIQTGGTINPGTNVAQTTVAEQLMTLAVKPAILG